MARNKPPIPWSLYSSVVVRKHTPTAGKGKKGRRAFKKCLRWEFHFTCIYCRLRESDFGYRPQSSFAVDHMVPRKVRPSAANDYANCYYVCRFCNSSKGVTWPSSDEQAAGFRFFDPCQDVASDHFAFKEDTVVALPDSKIAEYTLAEIRNINKDKTTKHRRRQVLERIRDLREMRRVVHKAARQAPQRGDRVLAKIDKWLDELYTPTMSRAPCHCGRAVGAIGETWPEGYFDVFGSLAETDLARPPQGQLSDDVAREAL